MIGEIAVNTLLEHVRELSGRYPHRHTGEADEVAAVHYIVGVFRALGIEPNVHEIPIMGWELLGDTQLRLAMPDWRSVAAVPFIFSGSTPPQGVRGRLVYVGETLVVGIRPPWKKFAIVDVAGQTRAYVVARPTGEAVTQSGPPDGFEGTQDGPHYTWPACVIGSADLAAITQYLEHQNEIDASLILSARYKPGQTTFVVEAELYGSKDPDQLVVIGAHHDCQGALGLPERFDSPGACDNASGVAAVLEMARYYSHHDHNKTLRFCTYGGEEWNLIGSRHYVRHLIETSQLSRISAAVNLDQTANGETLRVFASGRGQRTNPILDMPRLATDVVDRLKLRNDFDVTIEVPPMPGSDHWPFHCAGVPSFMAAWDPIPHYHSSGDTLASCDRDDKYAAAVGLTLAIVQELDRA